MVYYLSMVSNDEFLIEYARDLQQHFGWHPHDIRLKRLIQSAIEDPIRSKRHHQQIINMIKRSSGEHYDQT